MRFVTDVLIGGSFADWFAHYSLHKNYNFDPSFGPKISPDHVSCDAKIFIGPRGFLSDMSSGPTNFVNTVCTLGKKQRHGLTVHRFYHAAFAPKQWNGAEMALGLRYGDCRLFLNANCGEKNLESGQNGRVGRISGNETFFLWPFHI